MKNLNPDKKIIYILNKYGYKKDIKTSRICSSTDYYRKGSIENDDLEIVEVRRFYIPKQTYLQEIIVVSFDNYYFMDVGKATAVWKGSYKLACDEEYFRDYFHIETMSWYLCDKYREIIENINTRLHKLKEEGK